MKARIGTFFYRAMLVTGIASSLFGAVGTAYLMGWSADTTGINASILALQQLAPAAAGKARASPRCPECGMVVSAGHKEIVVRMADGSIRVIEQESPARWRPGERLIVIAGAVPPQP